MESDVRQNDINGPRDHGTATTGDPVSALPQVLDLTRAQSLRDLLVTLINRGSVALDAAAVERMSTPCAQVLLAAGRAAAAAGADYKILNASAPFRTALDDLGLEQEFSMWMT